MVEHYNPWKCSSAGVERSGEMEMGKEMVTEEKSTKVSFPFSLIFKVRGSSAARELILKKHDGKLFVAIVESDYPPDSITDKIAGAVLNFVARKYNEHKR